MKLAFIYLASGFGRRFGSNKLLYNLQGRPLYQHGFLALQQAKQQLEEKGYNIELVVISQYLTILRWCEEQGAKGIFNAHSAEGITASVKLGTKKAAACDALLFCVADQPYLTAETIGKLVEGYAVSGKTLGCIGCGQRQGNPSLFAKQYVKELLSLKGDRGGRFILQKHPQEIFVTSAAARELIDIDEAKDVE